jgi:PAS domain S-box-containing protein
MMDIAESQYPDRKFMALLESAPDSMVIAADNGVILMINKQTELLFGYTRDEIIGKDVEILIPERYHKRHRREREAYTATPRTRPMGIGLELFGRRKDGTNFPVEVSLSPLQSDTPGKTMIIAAIRDVSAQKQASAELARRTAELEDINRELEAFSYTVSHDLRAPLRSIEGFSNKILNEFAGQMNESGREYFMRIIKASRHMGVLIEDLLKLSRLSRVEFKPEYTDISEIATSISNELVAGEPQRLADIRIEPGVTARVDKNLIRIALQNLFDNAWKYSRKNEQTVIEFGRQGQIHQTVYYIKDNGVGFNMKYAGSLFKAFQRLHVHSEFEGTGVGLATVRRIIDRHWGEIWAESEENKGASFYFTLFSKS